MKPEEAQSAWSSDTSLIWEAGQVTGDGGIGWDQEQRPLYKEHCSLPKGSTLRPQPLPTGLLQSFSHMWDHFL